LKNLRELNTWNSHDDKPRLYGNSPAHGAQLVLDTLGSMRMGRGIVVQHEHVRALFLDGGFREFCGNAEW
jgi:hypothetical protein